MLQCDKDLKTPILPTNCCGLKKFSSAERIIANAECIGLSVFLHLIDSYRTKWTYQTDGWPGSRGANGFGNAVARVEHDHVRQTQVREDYEMDEGGLDQDAVIMHFWLAATEMPSRHVIA